MPYSSVASGKGTTSNTTVVGQKAKTAAPSAPAVLRGTLMATVSAAGKPTLTFRGKPVTSLEAGRYTVQVSDSSRQSGLVIQETGQNAVAVAPVAYTGKRLTALTLRAGQWFFYPMFVGKKTYFLVTTK